MARGSVNSFPPTRDCGWIPATHQTSEHALKEEKRPGPNFLYIHHSDSTDPQTVLDVLQLA